MNAVPYIVGIVLVLYVFLRGAFIAQADMDERGTVSVDDPAYKGLEPEEAYRLYAKRRTMLTFLWPIYFLTVYWKKPAKSETRPE